MEGDRYFEGTRSFFTASDIVTPVANAYRMLAMLGDRRLGARVELLDAKPTVGAVGALPSAHPDGGVAVVVWHHNDDQYVRGMNEVELEVRDLPCAGRHVQVTQYLIDEHHSNSHTAWLGLGAPQDPSPEDVEATRRRSSLEVVHDEKLESCPNSLTFQVSLKCPGAMLVRVTSI
jgi:xylan 1,4-beta-xylosidase